MTNALDFIFNFLLRNYIKRFLLCVDSLNTFALA